MTTVMQVLKTIIEKKSDILLIADKLSFTNLHICNRGDDALTFIVDEKPSTDVATRIEREVDFKLLFAHIFQCQVEVIVTQAIEPKFLSTYYQKSKPITEINSSNAKIIYDGIDLDTYKFADLFQQANQGAALEGQYQQEVERVKFRLGISCQRPSASY
jgi:hypothetical protein